MHALWLQGVEAPEKGQPALELELELELELGLMR